MNHTKYTIFLFLVILFFSFPSFCQNQNTFKIGEINNEVEFIHDNTRSYTLYLPIQVIQNPESPIVYIFDSEGNRRDAINYFVEAADKYGYILVTANEDLTKDFNLALEVTDMIIEDLYLRFNLKGERMYAAGFLEGVQIASSIALITNVFCGIIDCQGKPPKTPIFKPSLKSDFAYVKFVNPTAINYLESKNFIEQLNLLGISTKIIDYKNNNSWPPSNFIIKAFEWLEQEHISNSKDSLLDNMF